MRKVLNIGGGARAIEIPAYYRDWEQYRLDVNPATDPDLVADARNLQVSLGPRSYDAVYCSHNLEHYYRSEVPIVLAGFLHVLRDDGFAEIRVPDIGGLMRQVVESRLDLEDTVYESPAGPITALDMLYGMNAKIMATDDAFRVYELHKTAFTSTSLPRMLHACGFQRVWCGEMGFEIIAYAFKTEPRDYHRDMFGISLS